MAIQNSFYNPTNEQRHQIFYESLNRAGRVEDFENIIDLLSPPADIYRYSQPMSLSNVNIGIIGGGLAGLCSAYELRKLGANITIFDAEENRIGGRIYTHYFDNSKKYFSELGAMRMPVSHETTWHYINLFNLNTESLTSPQSNNFMYMNNIRMRRDFSGQSITENLYPFYSLTEIERSTPWNELSSYASETVLNNMTPQQRTEILKILPQYSEQYTYLTKLSERQVYEILGLSQGAINLITSVEPFTSAGMNLGYNNSLNGLYSLDFLNTYRITGGMVNLPLAFINSLESNNPKEFMYDPNLLGKVNIKLGYAVNGISKSNDSVNIRYTDHNNNENMEQFDYVICAIPFSTLREVELYPYFSDQKMQAIKELNYLDAQKTAFFCRRRFWEEDEPYGRINGGISFTDLPIQSIVYPTDHIRCENGRNCTYEEPGTILASYNLGQDSLRVANQNPERRFELVKRNVELVHGTPEGYIDTLIESHRTVHWNNEPWARGAFAEGYPGQKLFFSYNMLLPEYNNKVFFAGEHVSTKPGWIQGALYSGKFVANQVALQLRNIF
ncbi:MAG: amine oxidase [Bacillota bacterium]|jgi:monoamine oxidase|nr:amine oxidase [Bacillota bacterium]